MWRRAKISSILLKECGRPSLSKAPPRPAVVWVRLTAQLGKKINSGLHIVILFIIGTASEERQLRSLTLEEGGCDGWKEKTDTGKPERWEKTFKQGICGGGEKKRVGKQTRKRGLQLPVSCVLPVSAASIPSAVLSSSSTRAFPRPRFLRKRRSLARLLEGRLVDCELVKYSPSCRWVSAAPGEGGAALWKLCVCVWARLFTCAQGEVTGARPLIKAAAQCTSFMKMSFPHLLRSPEGGYTTLLSNLDYTLNRVSSSRWLILTSSVQSDQVWSVHGICERYILWFVWAVIAQ